MRSQMEQTGVERRTAQSSPECRLVLPDDLGGIWPHVEPMIARGMRHGLGDESTPEHMRAKLLLRQLHMLVAVVGGDVMGGVVWHFRTVDLGTKIWIDMIFGKQMDEWIGQLMEAGKRV